MLLSSKLETEITARQPFLARNSGGCQSGRQSESWDEEEEMEAGKLQETWSYDETCILNDSDDDAKFFFLSFLSTSNFTSLLTYQEDWTFEELIM